MSDLSVQILKKKEKDSNFPFGPVLEWKYSPKIDLLRFFMKVDFPFVDSDGRDKNFAECSSQYAICIYMQPDI